MRKTKTSRIHCFWGQNDELATKSDPEIYIGDLEFVLEQRSPVKVQSFN
jgi:hypothetical protein